MRFNDLKKTISESDQSLNDKLYDLESALRQARDITKQIKYTDTHMTVISELESLAEEHGLKLDEYNINQVYRANNNLESAVYELEEVFEEAVREIQMKIDDLEFEEGITTKHSYDPVKPGGQSKPRKPVPVKGQKVTLDNVVYKVTHVSADRKTFDVVNVKDDKERHIDIKVDSNPFFIEGKSPHKKGTKKYKKHMAAMHAESSSFRKESLEALARHVKEGVPLPDSLFRYQSEAYFDTFKQAKQLREMGSLPELDWESEEMLSTDIGESVALKGIGTVWLDVPYLDESDDYEMTTCDYCHGNEWDPDGPQDDDDHDDCPKCAGTGEIPKDDLGGSLTSEGSYQDPVRDIINRNGGSKLLQQYADGEKQFYGTQMFDELYDYYSNSGDMPYGTMTGDDGDAEVWILDELESEGYVDHPSDGPEDCMACGGTGFDPDQPEKSCKACDGEGYDDGYFGGTKAYEDINKMRKLAGLPEAEYNGKKVQLNKPKRGGSKKYYVYVKNPKTDRVKKISFGDPGLKTKSGNKGRAKSFAARHNCEKKNDKMKAGYWACRLPRYGLVKGGKWW